MKIMAVDYGDARTGVAISGATGLLPGFSTVIQSRNPAIVQKELSQLAAEHSVEEIVIGLPRNMDGSEGPRAQRCREFAHQMEELIKLPIALWDERRTTVEAHAILHENGKKMKNHRKNVDAVAASLILESYLTKKRLERGE